MTAKCISIFIAFMLMKSACVAQNSCDSLQILLKFLDNTYEQNRAEKDAGKRKILYKTYILQSAVAATMAERCFKIQGATDNSKKLKNDYLVGKLYFQAGDCNKAGSNFDRCLANPVCSSEKIGNYGNYAQLINKAFKCTNNQPVASQETNSYLKLYDGKGSAFLKEVFSQIDSLTFDANPLTPFELETIANRTLYATDKIDEGLVQRLSGNKAYLLQTPFLFMKGKGEFVGQMLMPEKTAAGGQMINNLPKPDLKQFSDFLLQQYSRLKDTYFDKLKGEKLIPVYLNGGDYTRYGLEQYLSFCNDIHFRASKKVAYYMSLDNSIVAWTSSGGGTLIHEMLHALIANDNPGAPLWLNEGLASLYEESTTGGMPINNYRLAFIHHAFIQDKICIDWTDLPAMETYRNASEINYNLLSAYSRYFCKFLYDAYSPELLQQVYKGTRCDTVATAAAQVKLICSLTKKKPGQLQEQWQQYLLSQTVPAKWKSLVTGIQQDFKQHDSYVFKASGKRPSNKSIKALKASYDKPTSNSTAPTEIRNTIQQY